MKKIIAIAGAVLTILAAFMSIFASCSTKPVTSPKVTAPAPTYTVSVMSNHERWANLVKFATQCKDKRGETTRRLSYTTAVDGSIFSVRVYADESPEAVVVYPATFNSYYTTPEGKLRATRVASNVGGTDITYPPNVATATVWETEALQMFGELLKQACPQ